MKYINKTNAAGIHITEASPVDDRLIISTEQEIAILVNKEPMPSVMYVWWLLLQIPKNVYLVRISTRSYGNWIHVP
jgi:hypothetical protein